MTLANRDDRRPTTDDGLVVGGQWSVVASLWHMVMSSWYKQAQHDRSVTLRLPIPGRLLKLPFYQGEVDCRKRVGHRQRTVARERQRRRGIVNRHLGLRALRRLSHRRCGDG